MPEGDTIHYAANRIRAALSGNVPEVVQTPQPRHAHDRWPERLQGRAVRAVEAYGKHLFLVFDGGLILHSHLRMSGAWAVYRPQQRWKRSPRRAWLVIRCEDRAVVQFDGPVLELMTEARRRSDRRLALLGPDILAADFDESTFLRRLREDDPTRPAGDALLDQRTIAGIGNFWKAEACFAAGISPWRSVGELTDPEAQSIVRWIRPRMQQSASDGHQARFRRIYGMAGRQCPRCGAGIRSRGQWEHNRLTFWCPSCQL